MSRILFGILLIIFGALFLLNTLDIIRPDLAMEYLNLVQKYWPGLLILLGLQIIVREKNPGLAQALKWLLILLAGLWIFCTFFIKSEWITLLR